MASKSLKLRIIFFFKICILFSFFYIATSQTTTMDYLYKYELLYNSNKYKISNNYKFVNDTTFVCKQASLECSGNGVCADNNTTCNCNPGYTTIPGSYIKCNYQQKSKTTAILLEGFLGFGFGHLYIQSYTMFVGKFLFYFFSCYFNFCIMIFVGSINNSNVDEKTYSYTKRTTFILVPIMIAWYIGDLVLFIMNSYTDNNGIELY